MIAIPPPPIKPPQAIAAVKYTANGIAYRVSSNDGKTFALYGVPFARFDCATGKCDRYVGVTVYDTPPDGPETLERLMLDCSSLMRHGKDWLARPMFGKRALFYGKTPIEAARKAVESCKK